MACSCYCHLPGTKVHTVDGEPCCSDMGARALPKTPTAQLPTKRKPRVSHAAPKVNEYRPGKEIKEEG